MDSEEELDFYCTDEEAMEDRGSDQESGNLVSHQSPKNYTILSEAEIKRRQEEDISTVSSVLSVPRYAAYALLRRYNWTISNLYDEWFANEERVRDSVGILQVQEPNSDPSPKRNRIVCRICFERMSPERMMSAACGAHPFCSDCWETYVSTSIQDGPGCLGLRCPEPSCRSIVGLDMIELLSSDEDKERYHSFLHRSYVEGSRNRKWCPAPGCDLVVQFEADGSQNTMYDVVCACSYRFCWNCGEESHRPVDCHTVGEWIKKNSSEAGNTQWILAYTKPCPKCKRAIEKNHGCNHMTCTEPCKHEFCWFCLAPWQSHGYSYNCNGYQANDDEASVKEEKNRALARKQLERYMHYYERWDTNDKSRKRALKELSGAIVEQIQKLARVQEKPEIEFDFLIEAWNQIVECRRVLKWTYAYGYYIPTKEKKKMTFFECLQAEAEYALEKLHHCAEREMKEYLGADGPLEDFGHFKTKIVSLTGVSRNYFESLVEALENGLDEVAKSKTSKKSKQTKA